MTYPKPLRVMYWFRHCKVEVMAAALPIVYLD